MGTAQRERSTYGAAHFVLEIDGLDKVGIVRSIDGGGIKSEIMAYQMGDNHDIWHQIGKPKYEDLKVEFGMSMSEGFYEWIESFFSGEVVRKNGAVLAGDFQYTERARRVFEDALISEITFPTLDASDQNPCYMTATLVAERLRFARGTNQSLATAIGQMRQKLWTSSNFEFTIDGPLKDQCRRVTKVDGFTIKQQIHEYHCGDKRDSIRVPGLMEFPNLSFYIPESDADPFMEHYSRYGIGGELQPSPRLTGAIVPKDSRDGDLCTIKLEGVEIAHVAPQKSDATSEDIKQVKIEISVECMGFDYGNNSQD